VDGPDEFLAKVRRLLERLGLGGGPGVVAVSGGPDSLALLRALAALRPAGAVGPLVVAHLNHRLRGAEADADEDFVRALHARLAAAGPGGLLWRAARADVAGEARRRGAGLEETAREVRYGWLAEVAAEAGAAWVATGHTADDQAETVLHRLLRGAGLRGLAGIPRRRPLRPGVEVVRPLLEVRRAEVLAYLESLGQDWREDETNADPRHTRNRIRHELLPLLAQRYNPAVVPLLGRLAEQADEACRAAEEEAAGLLREAELPRAGPLLVFDAARLGRAPRRLVREAFRLAWRREGWPLGEMGFAEWDRAAAVALGEAPAADLPGGVRVRRRGRVVQAGRLRLSGTAR
jgi:tRNA(Ile)-lysidine synthase